MKKTFFGFFIGIFSLFSLSVLHAMEIDKIDQENRSVVTKSAPSSEEIQKLTEQLSFLKKQYEEKIEAQDKRIALLESKCSSHDKILERNPPLRRTIRVGAQFWLPIAVGGVYYLFSHDISGSLAIASYGMSILFVSWNQTFRADDTFYPVTRTIAPPSDKKQK
ncbi:MAG: hypothetical protein HYX35_01190 [Proteobacteria bacterium]|nr:hypothetical protein [Pseudomonadota bacterium]